MQQEQTTGVKPKVAYLMGAGASANALPTIRDIGKRFENHTAWVEKQLVELRAVPAPESFADVPSKIPLYIEQLKRVMEASFPYGSIDTYARWLGQDNPELDALKAVLSTFFAIEQHENGFDSRYESFVSTTLDFEKGRFHPGMTILTWNYDQQLAMALRRVREWKHVVDVMNDQGIRSLYHLVKYPNTAWRVLHLNGFAGVHARVKDSPVFDFQQTDSTPLSRWAHWMYWFHHILHQRFNSKDGPAMLSYAWESAANDPLAWEGITSQLSDVEKLIVIGYSFPDFNRAIDRRMIRSMGVLKQIVVQTSPTSMAGILTKLRMVFPEHKDKLVPYELTHEFYVPNELLED